MPLDVADHTLRGDALLGVAFSGYGAIAPASSQFAFIQLWNPSNSGVKAFVSAVGPITATTTALACDLVFNTSQLAGSSTFGVNKQTGSTAAKCQVITFSNSVGPSGSFLAHFTGVSGIIYPYIYQPQNPFILLPGNGLILGCENANAVVGATYEWVEQ